MRLSLSLNTPPQASVPAQLTSCLPKPALCCPTPWHPALSPRGALVLSSPCRSVVQTPIPWGPRVGGSLSPLVSSPASRDGGAYPTGLWED